MRSLPINLILEKNKLATDSSFVVLTELTLLDDAGTVLKFAANQENVIIPTDDVPSSLSSDLVAHWKCNDNAATTTVADSSGNSHTGTLNGGDNTEDITTSGRALQSLHFDGTADFVAVTHSSALDPGTGDFSISLFVNRDDLSPGVNERVIFKNDGGAPPFNGYYLMFNTTDNLSFSLSDNASTITASDSNVLSTNTWHHIVAVRDTTASKLRLYVNGVLEDERDDPTNDINGGFPLWWGGRSGAEWFDGRVDNLMIFDKALTTTDISNLSSAATTYTAFAFEIGTQKSNSEGKIPSVVLRVNNITREIQAYLDALKGGIGSTVKIIVVNTDLLTEDYTELEIEYEVIATTSTEQWVTFTLGAPSPLRARFPLYRYLADSCNWVFREIECGYDGELLTCGRTFSECTIRTNTPRYGGFRGLRNDSNKIV